jgi:hypothetical protein
VFTIGDAGLLTLALANDALVVISIAPASGWQVASVSHVSNSEIVVDFTSPADHVTALARLGADGITVTFAGTGTGTTAVSDSTTPEPSASPAATAVSPATTPGAVRPAPTTARTLPPRATGTTTPHVRPTPAATIDDAAPGTPSGEHHADGTGQGGGPDD